MDTEPPMLEPLEPIEPYRHPLTDRLNAELTARGFPATRRERRRVMAKLKKQLKKMSRPQGES